MVPFFQDSRDGKLLRPELQQLRGYVDGIQQKDEWSDKAGECCSQCSGSGTQSKIVDREPLHEDVDGQGDQKNIDTSEVFLSLHGLLTSLKIGVATNADQ